MRQRYANILFIAHEEGRNKQLFAEPFQGLVDGHARCVACHFDQHTARFAHVKRVEIFPIVGVGRGRVQGLQVGERLFQLIHITGAKGDMIDRARPWRA